MSSAAPGSLAVLPATMPEGTHLAVFAAGCFWGTESTFAALPGVTGTRVGYTGGNDDMGTVTYKAVCGGDTNHAEAVRVEYTPDTITYEKLLDVFFENHNPTTLNRQGPDVGTQYRSAVFYFNDEQRAAAEAAIEKHQPRFQRPIVTQVLPAAPFHEAEEYHQQYLAKQGRTTCTR